MSAAPPLPTYQPVLSPDGVVGIRCVTCSRAGAPATRRCGACGGPVVREVFAPRGTVWSSTVIHIDVGPFGPPYALAYIDLDDGPRVLARQREARVLSIGGRVVALPSQRHDVWCEVVEEEQS